jgi:hypothetical protein
MADSNETLNQGQSGDGGGGRPPAEGPETVDLRTLTKEQLLTRAEQIGVKAKPAMSKDEIIKVIEDFQADREENGRPSAGEQERTGDEKPPENKSEAVPQAGEPIGKIKTVDGVEYVNVGDAWVPVIRDNTASDKPVVVVSEKRAGKTIFAKTGKPITFDENGRATVSADDARYLTSIVIDEVPEYTVEGNE